MLIFCLSFLDGLCGAAAFVPREESSRTDGAKQEQFDLCVCVRCSCSLFLLS